MTPQPQHRADTLAALQERLYAALKHEKSCTCGDCSGGLNAVDDLVALAHAGAETERLLALADDIGRRRGMIDREVVAGMIREALADGQADTAGSFEERHGIDAAGNPHTYVWCRRCGENHQRPEHCPRGQADKCQHDEQFDCPVCRDPEEWPQLGQARQGADDVTALYERLAQEQVEAAKLGGRVWREYVARAVAETGIRWDRLREVLNPYCAEIYAEREGNAA